MFSIVFSAISPPMITVSPSLTVTCVFTVLLVERGLSVPTSAAERRASTEALTVKVILDSSLIRGVTLRLIPTSFSVICLALLITVDPTPPVPPVVPPVVPPRF